MDLKVKKLEEVWTADGKKLGLAQQLFHRLDEINPDLQLFASYLVVENYDYGEVFYVPTDFIDASPGEADQLTLTVTKDQVLRRTWFRMPNFVASNQVRKESLGDG